MYHQHIINSSLIKPVTITNTEMMLRDANIAQVHHMALGTIQVALPPGLDKTSSLPPIYFLVSSFSVPSIPFIYEHIFSNKDK
jgi:hypothetical protein